MDDEHLRRMAEALNTLAQAEATEAWAREQLRDVLAQLSTGQLWTLAYVVQDAMRTKQAN